MDWNKHFSQMGADPAPVPFKANSVAAVTGINTLSKANLSALYKAAKQIGVPVDWIATVMAFETGGTFSPSVLNKAGSGAFGLIQFMPSTAQALLKTATREEAVKKGMSMTFAEQLQKMVVPYFASYKGKLNSLHDVYLAVFYPAAMNKDDSHVVGSAPSPVYTQNAGFDKTGKGYITRSDITSTITGVWDRAQAYARIPITVGYWGQVLAGLAISAGLGYAVIRMEDKRPLSDIAKNIFKKA